MFPQQRWGAQGGAPQGRKVLTGRTAAEEESLEKERVVQVRRLGQMAAQPTESAQGLIFYDPASRQYSLRPFPSSVGSWAPPMDPAGGSAMRMPMAMGMRGMQGMPFMGRWHSTAGHGSNQPRSTAPLQAQANVAMSGGRGAAANPAALAANGAALAANANGSTPGLASATAAMRDLPLGRPW